MDPAAQIREAPALDRVDRGRLRAAQVEVVAEGAGDVDAVEVVRGETGMLEQQLVSGPGADGGVVGRHGEDAAHPGADAALGAELAVDPRGREDVVLHDGVLRAGGNGGTRVVLGAEQLVDDDHDRTPLSLGGARTVYPGGYR
jgi:hypothetical protein